MENNSGRTLGLWVELVEEGIFWFLVLNQTAHASGLNSMDENERMRCISSRRQRELRRVGFAVFAI